MSNEIRIVYILRCLFFPRFKFQLRMKKFTKKVHHVEKKSTSCREEEKLPIVFSPHYGVNFAGLQKLHPFDAQKGFRIFQMLKAQKLLCDEKIYNPQEIKEKDLLRVHTKTYIQSLKWSYNAAKIAEIPILFFVPNSLVQRGYLKPMRYQVAGSLLAGQLAMKEGWSINLGGGFHHCCAYKGGGFCPYADITLLITLLMKEENLIKTAMIIDLDAHQGNGHERDFIDNPNVYILDMYNAFIYPRDYEAKLAINCAVELRPRTEDEIYIGKLKKSLNKSLSEFIPDIIVYNAGTDILINDPLGMLSITPQGVIDRDEIVFKTAMDRKIPIVMLLSGGYLRSSAGVIADSILNLKSKNLFPLKM